MAKYANPGVEVAKIKPSKPGRQGKLFLGKGRDVVTINTTLNDLITQAYGLNVRQVVGGQSAPARRALCRGVVKGLTSALDVTRA
jgi:uncharacterized protein (TIGR03435 family)